MNEHAAARRHNLIIAAILVVGLIVGLAIAGGDLSRLPLQDDSFYNFSIARNLALGHGTTYDGVHETNGFHPIVVGTMSVLYRIFDGDTERSVHVLLIVMVFVNLATVFIVLRLVSRLVAPRAGLILGFLWIMSPYYWWMFLNGMDTGINIMLTVASLSVYLGRIRERDDASTGAFLALGLLLGLVVFSRMDGLLLVGVIGLDVMIRAARLGGLAALKRAVFRLALLSVCVCIVVAPWVKFNLNLTGSPVQISGQAIRFLSVLKLPKDRAIEEHVFFDRESDLARINGERVERFNHGKLLEPYFYVKSCALVAGQITATYPLMSPLFLLLYLAGLNTGHLFMASRAILAAGMGAVVLAAILAFVLVGRFRRRVTGFLRSTHMPGLGILWAFAALLVVVYVFYIMGWMFYYRYLFIINILFLVHGAIGIYRLLGPAEGRRTAIGKWSARGLVCMVLALFVASSIWANTVFKNEEFGKFKDLAAWMEENLEKDARIGVFQSGIVNYLSPKTIVPLGGKINIEGLEAARAGRMAAYVMEKDLDYIIDDPRVLEVSLVYLSEEPIDSYFAVMDKQKYFWVLKRIRND